jgi:hypothetical protein
LEIPTGQRAPVLLSIKAQLEAIKQSQKEVNEEQLPRFGFTAETARSSVRKYAHQVKEQGKDTFYHALIKRDPVVSDETITLLLDNSVQVEYIKPLLVEFSAFLKEELNNGFLDIQLQITEEEEKATKPITGKDKYNALARKNQNIHTLRSRFDLDIEY